MTQRFVSLAVRAARAAAAALPAVSLTLAAAFACSAFSDTTAQDVDGSSSVFRGVHSTNCPADNARFNNLTPYKTSLDYVPVSGDDSLGFHVAYSGKSSNSNANVLAFNVGIYMFPLTDGSLLVFGGGYGDPSGAGTAYNDAAYDAANVESMVRNCLGRTPASTPIEFVSPHWHGDHVNEEFLRELENLGFSVRAIVYHEDDDSFIRSFYSWTQAEIAKFETLPDGNCNVEIGSYDSTLGRIWFIARSGHAPGAIDLVLDVWGNPEDRVLVLGSEAGGNCPTPPSGVRQTFNAHGNVQFSQAPQVVPFGCGVNPSGSLTVLSGEPKIGTDILFGIDDPLADMTPGQTLPLLYSSLSTDPNRPCGTLVQLSTMVRPYELLIDPLDGSGWDPPLMGGVWMGPGSPVPIEVAVPLDPGSIGRSIYLQAAMFDMPQGSRVATGIMLTEALEIRIGR